MSEFYSNFNYKRYNKTGPSLQSPGEDAYAKRGMVIQFDHIPTGNVVNFKAFLTAFNESYTPTWTTEEVLGRMDPIYLFKDTRRTISLAFKVPAVSKSEAYENLGKVQLLAQFLYPTFKDPAQAQTIVQSPLVRIKMMNIIRNTNNLEFNNEQTNPELYNQYDMAGTGLLGTISNVTLNHNLDGNHGVIEKSNKDGLQALLPRLIEVNMDFSPLHEHPLGWDANDKFGQFGEDNGELFPYGVALSDNSNKSALDLQAEEAQTPDIPSDDADELEADETELSPGETPAANDDDMNNGASAEASAASQSAQMSSAEYSLSTDYDPDLLEEAREYEDPDYGIAMGARDDTPELDPGSLFSEEEVDIMTTPRFEAD
mgnify:CR=1 FL=1|tara:strand:- start:1 stop:1116 length:1116 start_codon:yes stop_codon:yes gene_type:complete